MKLLEAIANLDAHICSKDDLLHLNAARTFLFGTSHPEAHQPISPTAFETIDSLGLAGDDFTLLGFGAGGVAFGNETQVFRLESSDTDLKREFALPLQKIPDGLAASIYKQGECNGIKYRVSERLNTKNPATTQELVSFLFQSRDKGVVYYDACPDNFGYDSNGELKVLDHDHFQEFEKPPSNFSSALETLLFSDAFEVFKDPKKKIFPIIFSDNDNTYFIFHPNLSKENSRNLSKENSRTAEQELLQKKVLAGLETVGIDAHSIEIIDVPPLLRIGKREISFGTPPHNEKLTDYLTQLSNTDQPLKKEKIVTTDSTFKTSPPQR